MLKADSVLPFSPSAFRPLHQTSVLHAGKQTTGAALSLIGKTEADNYPLPRHRTEIHLLPKIQTYATGFRLREPTGAGAKVNDSTGKPPNLSSTSGRKPMAIVTRRSVQN
jgi:hypothetical protein